jgi:hypothetical protein
MCSGKKWHPEVFAMYTEVDEDVQAIMKWVLKVLLVSLLNRSSIRLLSQRFFCT